MNEQAATDKDSQRGSANRAEPHFLVIGEVLKPHGVRGEVRVLPHTDLPERFRWLEHVYIGERERQRVAVEGVRFHKNLVLLKLAGYNSREATVALRGKLLFVPEEDALPLAEGEYFLYQLEGLAVYADTGELLGTLVEVLETKANNVFVVRGERGELLLPDIEEVVQSIDFETQQIVVHLIDGLLP